MFVYETAFRKHIDSKKCKIKEEADKDKILVFEKKTMLRQGTALKRFLCFSIDIS